MQLHVYLIIYTDILPTRVPLRIYHLPLNHGCWNDIWRRQRQTDIAGEQSCSWNFERTGFLGVCMSSWQGIWRPGDISNKKSWKHIHCSPCEIKGSLPKEEHLLWDTPTQRMNLISIRFGFFWPIALTRKEGWMRDAAIHSCHSHQSRRSYTTVESINLVHTGIS